jgi:hypothetical protein
MGAKIYAVMVQYGNKTQALHFLINYTQVIYEIV